MSKDKETPIIDEPEVLEYDISIKSHQVKIRDEKGQVQTYILRELTGAERDAYLTGIGNRMRVGKSGKTQGLKSFKDLQASLLVLGLYHADGKPVSIKTVQSWPARVQQDLHDRLKKMSGMDIEEKDDDEEDDEAKND